MLLNKRESFYQWANEEELRIPIVEGYNYRYCDELDGLLYEKSVGRFHYTMKVDKSCLRRIQGEKLIKDLKREIDKCCSVFYAEFIIKGLSEHISVDVAKKQPSIGLDY